MSTSDMDPSSEMSDFDFDAHMAALERENAELTKQLQKKEELVSKLKVAAVVTHQAVETEEERHSRRLLRRMDLTKKDMATIKQKIRCIEKQNTDAATRIDELKKEKTKIENSIECEQEQLVNRLHKQLLKATQDRGALLKTLHTERAAFVESLENEVARLKATLPAVTVAETDTPTKLSVSSESTEAQILELEAQLRTILEEMRADAEERAQLETQVGQLGTTLHQYKSERFLERAKELKLQEELERVQGELANAERMQERPIGSFASSPPSAVVATTSVPRVRHHQRTSSMSSNESSISSSASSQSSLNLFLAYSRDPRLAVREHTARVLSTPTLLTGSGPLPHMSTGSEQVTSPGALHREASTGRMSATSNITSPAPAPQQTPRSC